MPKTLFIAFLISSSIYIISTAFTPYPLDFAIKVIPIVLLGLYAAQQLTGKVKTLTLAALIFSGCGDILLALQFHNQFIFGLGAFLIAQLIYTALFFQHRSPVNLKLKWQLSLLVVLYSFVMANIIQPPQPELKIAVISYLTVITAMALSALFTIRRSPILFIGALTFVASDSLIALNTFRQPIPMASVAIMFTYYAAQYMIVKGIVKLQREG